MSSKVASSPNQNNDERTASSWRKVRRVVQKMCVVPSGLTVIGFLAICHIVYLRNTVHNLELRLESEIARDDIVEEAAAHRLVNPRRLAVGNILPYNSGSLSLSAGCVTVSMLADVTLDLSTLACGSSNRVCPPCFALTGDAALRKLTISTCSTAYVTPNTKLGTAEQTSSSPYTTIGGQSFTFFNLHASYVMLVSDGTNDYYIGPGVSAQAFCHSSSSNALYFSHRFDSIDINGGTIDGVTIGASSPPTVTNLGSVATCDINGGTIDGVTIGASATVTLGTNTAMTGGTINGVTIGGTSTVTLSTNTAMTGGTIDGASIGSSTPSTVIGTTVKFSTTSGLLDNAGTRLLTTQQSAVADTTDTSDAATQLNLLLAALRAHGLIAMR